LASEATKIYEDDLIAYADRETRGIIKKGSNPLTFKGLAFTDSTEASRALNSDPVPKVIISSSGMCEGGRIGHHLKHNLWKEECSLVFVGFQAYGTLGREILEGAERVEVLVEEIAVRATVYNYTGLSAHADRDGLLKWINSFKKKPDNVFVTHGEDTVCKLFANSLKDMGLSAVAPLYKSVYDLGNGKLTTQGIEIDRHQTGGQ